MHFAVDDGRGRCIKSGGLSSRLVPPAVVNGGTIRAELSQSVEIDGIAPPCIRRVMNESRRISLKLTDDREHQIEKASEIVSSGPEDDPPMSVVIDVALAHLIQSEENIHDAREELDPATIQQFNTDIIGLRYRTQVTSRWR